MIYCILCWLNFFIEFFVLVVRIKVRLSPFHQMNQSFHSTPLSANSRRHPVWPHRLTSEIFEANRFEYRSEASRAIRGNAFEQDDETLSGVSSLPVSLTDTSGFFSTPSSSSESDLWGATVHSSSSSYSFSDRAQDYEMRSINESDYTEGERLVPFHFSTTSGNFGASEVSLTSDEYINFELPSDSQSRESSVFEEESMEYENEALEDFE